MKDLKKVVPEAVRQALDATGLPWTVERGSKHYKLRLDGRLAGILPIGKMRDKNVRPVLNTVRGIRHMHREMEEKA